MQLIKSNDEIEKAAIVLADAFKDYPLYTYLFPEEKIRSKLLPVIFKCSIEYSSEFTYHISDEENMQAVLIIDSPNFKISMKSVLSLLLKYGKRFPLKPSLKMLTIFKELDQKPVGKYFYVQSIGISSKFQRRGLGRTCLEFAKQLALNEGLYLETNSAANVAYYERNGFQLQHHFKVDKGRGPDAWSFVLEM